MTTIDSQRIRKSQARENDPLPVSIQQPESTAASEKSQSQTLRADIRKFNFWYSETQALYDINMPIHDRQVTSIIGASGCGKSTLLRSLNRLHDLYPGNRYEGDIRLYPEDINLVTMDPMLVRLRVGMVFQKPNPFPKSVYENIASGLRVRGITNSTLITERVEASLKQAYLWEEMKDRLGSSAYALSGGQQQRLCIARALAPNPDMLLLDEPTSALDPISTAKIEELVRELSRIITVVIVTHNMQQASRISDYTAFMHLGKLVEFNDTEKLFKVPQLKQTEDYITGRYG